MAVENSKVEKHGQYLFKSVAAYSLKMSVEQYIHVNTPSKKDSTTIESSTSTH